MGLLMLIIMRLNNQSSLYLPARLWRAYAKRSPSPFVCCAVLQQGKSLAHKLAKREYTDIGAAAVTSLAPPHRSTTKPTGRGSLRKNMAHTIIQHPSGNFGYPHGQSGRNGFQPIAICDHTMQGHRAAYHVYLADSTKNAANYSVYQDGTIEQHVMDWDAAWCNGPMNKPDMSVPWIARCFHDNLNPNLFTLSIEHEGMTGVPLTEKQIQATVWLHQHLVTAHHIPHDRQHIVGHYQIDNVERHFCPGAAFPWDRIIRSLGH